ncbi:MAG: hypothetical protein AAGD07_24825, partial [Planctomycetota bacterium]
MHRSASLKPTDSEVPFLVSASRRNTGIRQRTLCVCSLLAAMATKAIATNGQKPPRWTDEHSRRRHGGLDGRR